ncbi:hypothetical protein KAM345_000370 [Aeromonas caviae]|uniref:DUF6216 family protein n=1 Tax=Aeromonas caviae TaxID=648 RepID=UPI001CC414B9|nr:DUF6216 family protein [Aeromonas caviae]BDA16123.1 hypothetical protein KAM345_000370 [Aeromonas caviae]
MEESVFGMAIDISGLPGPLLNMAILVVSFIGLRLFFHYRAGTSYGFVSRLYALLVGRSEYQDDTLAEFWRRNKELERFNAIFNFKAKLRIPVKLNSDSGICEHHFRKVCGQGFFEQKLSFEGRHLFDSLNKPAAKRSAAVVDPRRWNRTVHLTSEYVH